MGLAVRAPRRRHRDPWGLSPGKVRFLSLVGLWAEGRRTKDGRAGRGWRVRQKVVGDGEGGPGPETAEPNRWIGRNWRQIPPDDGPLFSSLALGRKTLTDRFYGRGEVSESTRSRSASR